MARDVKLGLALGILVLGFAAAFCFPRTFASSELAVVETPDVLRIDEALRQRPVRTYLGEELRFPRRRRSAASAAAEAPRDGASGPSIDVDPIAAAPPDPIPRPGVPATSESSTLANLTASTAESIAEGASPDARSGEPAPTVLDASPPSTVKNSASPAAAEGPEATYVVRTGDTLSGIAQRLLGSSKHFDRLFEANRDVLHSPDALRPGTTLRIPALSSAVAATAQAKPVADGAAASLERSPAPTAVRAPAAVVRLKRPGVAIAADAVPDPSAVPNPVPKDAPLTAPEGASDRPAADLQTTDGRRIASELPELEAEAPLRR